MIIFLSIIGYVLFGAFLYAGTVYEDLDDFEPDNFLGMVILWPFAISFFLGTKFFEYINNSTEKEDE